VTEVIRIDDSYKLYTTAVEQAVVEVLEMTHKKNSPIENLNAILQP